MKRLMVLLTAVVTTLSLTAQTVEVAPSSAAGLVLQSLVNSDASAEGAQIRNFYAPSGYRMVWTRDGRPTAHANAIINLFEAAEVKGLHAADYDADQWPVRLADLRNEAGQARFDYAMTAALMRYTNDVRNGRVMPQTVDFEIESGHDALYLPVFVNTAATSANPAALLASVEPQTSDYRNLIAALAVYRRIAQNDTDTLTIVNKLTKGDDYADLAKLAAKLRLYGDLATDAQVEGTKYEGAIVDAVKHFQSRHGLDADGVIAKGTFAQLNVPATQRVKQIELALERVRWNPEQIESPAIVVNIPEFALHAIGETELTMRVVVGKSAGHKTPVFEGDMKYVVFRPYWSVPPSIQRNEIAPKLTSDYAARNNYEVLDDAGRVQSIDADTVRKVRNGNLTVRQKPGTSNALGLVKFLFPNDYNVYLHSTPSQALFSRARRDFSHGCVRVEDPVKLAEWVLREKPEWNNAKIKSTIHGKQDDVYVNLARPISVKIVYHTVVAQSNGEVHFYDDVYGHDAKLVAALTPTATAGGVLMAAKK